MRSTITRSVPLNGTRILLVVENEPLYRALRDTLEDAGGEVLGAIAFMPRNTGLVPQGYIDLAVVDVSHIGNAVMLARELRQRDITSLFITASPLTFAIPRRCTFLSKPFTEGQLLNNICALVPCGAYEKTESADGHPHRAALGSLKDRAVMLIEDEYLIAMDMSYDLERAGATVVGPFGSVEDALTLLETMPALDAAVVDIRLRGDDAFAVADVLEDRKIPYIFSTGSNRSALPQRFHHVPWSAKPLDLRVLAEVLDSRLA
jgi:CheY-like chemotaxis protein